MNQVDVSVLLAVVGAATLLDAWIGRKTGDAARDVWLMFGVGGGAIAASIPLLFTA